MKPNTWTPALGVAMFALLVATVLFSYKLGHTLGYVKGWIRATDCYETEERILRGTESPDASCYSTNEGENHDRR